MKRIGLKLITLALLCAVALCAAPVRVQAEEFTITYVMRYWDNSAGRVTSETLTTREYPTGWGKIFPDPGSGDLSLEAGMTYYVDRDITVNGRLTFWGTSSVTSIVLGDGCTLDVKGVYVREDNQLQIFGQSGDTGRLISHASTGAGIGGISGQPCGAIVINGGIIEATGASHCAGIGGNDGQSHGDITIYGGTIRAKGGSDGAAIGGGRNCSGGNITIYGGNITANGPSDSDTCENGAGIGGGVSGTGGTIAIYGGTITTYSRDGAGIGGSDDGAGGTITIHGGNITSTKVNQGQGARIGGGCDGAPGTIVIDGGNITAVGGDGAGIGGGKGNKTGGTVTINGGVINASGSYGIGSGENGSDVAVTLGYTDGTRDGISITASSYNGTVTLGQPFAKFTGNAEQYLAGTFIPGVVSDNSLLGGGALKAWSGEVFDWQTLQMAIDGAGNGATITLSQDIVADYASDAALHVASGKNITIDLNGCTINRNLTDREAPVYGNQGYVILNEGTLTIADSSSAQTGTITGGNCKGAAGGIYNSGTLTITGGSITGNAATTWGGGIYLPNDTGAVLHLNGGAITNNTCGNNGGGVHVSSSAAMTVSGSPVVSGNTKNGAANNVNLASGAVMQVTGALTEGANLCVSASGGTAVITSGYGAKNGTTYPGAYFTADNANYGIALADCEVKIATPFTVTIPADDQARLSVDKPSAQQGDTVTITVLDDDTALNMISVYYVEGSSTKHVNFTPGTGKTGTFTMPATDVTVRVNPPVTYYENGSKTYSGSYTVVTSDTTTWTSGWYVVNEDVTINQRIEVSGNAKLVIMGTSENNWFSLNANAGIHVPSGSSLVIYGETNKYGIVTACTVDYALPSNCAAIGGNNGQDNGPITIHSGTVVAGSNGKAAAIGGGYNGDGSQITIHGGVVVATCSDNGAGIGGGECFSGSHGAGHHITINGGDVSASGGGGAGIGGGSHASGYNIVINGGAVSALGSLGAGIGGGERCLGYDIVINGGSIIARGIGSAGIGCGEGLGDIPGAGNNTKVVYLINGGRVEASSDVGHALVCGDAGNNGFILTGAIYLNAKVKGGSSSGSAIVISGSYDDIHNSRYILIEPCTHENATYEVISAETHLEQCDECLTEFTEEAHTLGADGICTVCGYDSNSSYVFFNSNGGNEVEAQLVANGQTAAQPEAPSWAGYVFQGWYLVTNAATGEHEATAFDFDNTPITQSITLIAVWNHKHDGITFQSWTSDSSLPTSAGSYFLTKDVTLTSVWAWNSGTLNLCLAGHTVTGNINNSSDALITVNSGTLNLFDEEDGTVTLVNARAATVAVETGGTFNLHGGTITSETNDSSLQGVDVAGTFHMSGGRITGNPTGVRVKRGGAFTVSGSARVTGNTVNVDLTLGNGKIQIGGALSDDARIGVTAYAGVVTSGLSGNGTHWNFFSDTDGFLIGLNTAGEAILGASADIVFAPGIDGAEGGMFNLTAATGSVYTLPECKYSVDGMAFREWSVQAGNNDPVSMQPDETVVITADITVTAVWQPSGFGTPDFRIPGGVTVIEDNAFEGIAATVVEIPGGCTSIGDEAFKSCGQLTMIRIPSGCALGTDVFAGCAKVYVFGAAGSPAEAYCQAHDNCVFVTE